MRRTARLCEAMTGARRMTPRLRREILNLHRLLCLQAVDGRESLEAACFVLLDPGSDLVAELCRLGDGLRDHLEALAEAAPHRRELAEALAA